MIAQRTSHRAGYLLKNNYYTKSVHLIKSRFHQHIPDYSPLMIQEYILYIKVCNNILKKKLLVTKQKLIIF